MLLSLLLLLLVAGLCSGQNTAPVIGILTQDVNDTSSVRNGGRGIERVIERERH